MSLYTAHITYSAIRSISTSGELELVVKNQSYSLTTGSSMTFDSRDSHRYINPGDVDAHVMIIVNYE
jgi:uncharacterized cupin superfamily protein